METIISQIINHFDFAYMLVINILTYLIIKLVDYLNGNKVVSVLHKRLIFILATIIVTVLYCAIGYDNKIILVNSAICAPIAWSWILRPAIMKIGIGYKQNVEL